MSMSERPGAWGSGQASGPRTEWRTTMPIPEHHVYSHHIGADDGYPEDIANDFSEAAMRAAKATDGSGLIAVTMDQTRIAALVPLDLVEYALRHGWGR